MSDRLNYGTLIVSSLRDFQKTFPNMTFGEIMYSFLRNENSPVKNLKDIRELSDESIYESIEKALKYEQEEISNID